MEALRESLELYNVQTLREMATAMNLEFPPGQVRKNWFVKHLQKAIVKEVRSSDAIEHLGEAGRAILWLLLQQEGEAHVRDLVMPMLMAGLISVDGPDALKSHRPSLKAVLQELMLRGLVINQTMPQGASRRKFDPVEYVALAAEVKELLPQDLLEAPKPKPEQQKVPAPAYVASGSAEQFMRSIFLFWAEVRRQPAYELKAGGMGKRDMRRVAESMDLDLEPNVRHLQWLQAILEALELLKVRDRSYVAVESKEAQAFWKLPLKEQLLRVLETYPWLEYEIPVNMESLNRYAYYIYPSPRSKTALRSHFLETVLGVMPPVWFPVSMLLTFLNGGVNGEFVFSEDIVNALQRSLRWADAGRQQALQSVLNRAEYSVVNWLLEELHGMGLIDVGRPDRNSMITAFQVTPALRVAEEEEAVPELDRGAWQIVLKPDFELLAMGSVPMPILAILEVITDRSKLDEGVITYRLTRESVYRAFQSGETVDSIRKSLKEVTHQPLPQNVERTLEEWGDQYERIVLRRNVSVVQAESEALMTQLLEDPRVGGYLHRLNAETGWVHGKHAEKVAQRLWEMEMMPTYSRGPEADLPHSLVWQDERLVPRHPTPSLYVAGTMRRIAESEDGGWRMTPESVRAAVTKGMSVPEITALVERMTGRDLPPAWEQHIKAWGNYFGDGQASRVLLLRMESAEALAELRDADKQLHRWLRPLVKEEGLAVVNESHWDEVQALLKEWGVSVDEDARWW